MRRRWETCWLRWQERPTVSSNRLTGEALADQVELVERTVMKRNRTPAFAMGHLAPTPQQIAQLPLERDEIGVDGPLCIARRRAADIASGPGPDLFGQMFGLA